MNIGYIHSFLVSIFNDVEVTGVYLIMNPNLYQQLPHDTTVDTTSPNNHANGWCHNMQYNYFTAI